MENESIDEGGNDKKFRNRMIQFRDGKMSLNSSGDFIDDIMIEGNLAYGLELKMTQRT